MSERCRYHRAIDRHFAGTIAPRVERELRAHITTCSTCYAYYGRHLLLEAMIPATLGAKQRLARGLDLAPRRSSSWWRVSAAAGAIALIIALLTFRRHDDGEMTARGGPAASELVVYRIHGAEHGELGGVLNADDELSFAYRNTASKPYLVVFAVDERRAVYWYHPAWTDPSRSVPALAIASSAELVELPEAIRHDLTGNRLWIYAAFLDRPWSTREVESQIAGVTPGAPIQLDTTVTARYRVAVEH